MGPVTVWGGNSRLMRILTQGVREPPGEQASLHVSDVLYKSLFASLAPLVSVSNDGPNPPLTLSRLCYRRKLPAWPI